VTDIKRNFLRLCVFTILVPLLCPPAASAVVVQNVSELAEAVNQANGGGDRTILLEDGTYTLDGMLWVSAGGVTVRGLSGDREAVIIQGQGMAGPVTHVFNVAGSRFTVRDVTLRRVSRHAVQLQVDVDSVTIRNVRIQDTGEQMVKVAYNPGQMNLSSDGGRVENCLFEYTAGIGPQYYIGGIDAHNAGDWVVRRNTFSGIRSPSGDVAEHAVHFWSDSKNTLVENNLIINCDRGIGFGLGDRGHDGGIIRNNMIYHDDSEGFADVGIDLQSSPGTMVYNNTVYQEHSYHNAIEYRWPATTGVYIANNLTNRAISSRNGASGTVENNITGAEAGWFVSPPAGDLHLVDGTVPAVDAGAEVTGLIEDYDGDPRPRGSGIDVGADEYLPPGANRLINGSFDEGGRIPVPWRGKRLTGRDKRVIDLSHIGQGSFRMIGAGANKHIKQVVRISGSKGDEILVGGWSRAKRPKRTGGPYRIEVKVFYEDGSRKTYKKGFTKKTHGWEYKGKTFTAQKAYSKMTVHLRYGRQRGKAWFDDILLIVD
jgi:hypothetical protein